MVACWHGLCKTLRCLADAAADDEVEASVRSTSKWLKLPQLEDEEDDDSVTAANLKRRISLRECLILSNKGSVYDFYEIDDVKLGEGGFGQVRRATLRSTGEQHAIKIVRKADIADLPDFQLEITITKSLDHPGIVKLYETFEDPRKVYLAMELCGGGELFEHIIELGRLSEPQAATIMRQICRSVAYIHARGIVHRDLKPENFLFETKGPLEASALKVIDFGLAKYCSPGDVLTSCVGTPAYVAPEVIKGRHGQPCDLWSCGVLLYMLLSGCVPFSGSTAKEILRRVKKGEYTCEHDHFAGVTAEAKAIIHGLLEMDPELRLTAPQVLEHEWLVDSAPNASQEPLGHHIIENLRSFAHGSALKRAALTVIAGRLHEDDIKALKDIFLQLDTAFDGTLTGQELRDGLARMKVPIPGDFDRLVEAAGHNGRIDYTEFLAAALGSRTYLTEDLCWMAFKKFDRDGSGTISQDELRLVLAQEELQAVPEAQLLAALHEADENGDGTIDFHEFMDMMGSVKKSRSRKKT